MADWPACVYVNADTGKTAVLEPINLPFISGGWTGGYVSSGCNYVACVYVGVDADSVSIGTSETKMGECSDEELEEQTSHHCIHKDLPTLLIPVGATIVVDGKRYDCINDADPELEEQELIDPRILETEEEEMDAEGCFNPEVFPHGVAGGDTVATTSEMITCFPFDIKGEVFVGFLRFTLE